MPPPPRCGLPHCKAYFLSMREFQHLNGEWWSHSFVTRLGLRARKHYKALYGKSARMKRGHSTHRNRVAKYPCGMLERAMRELKAEDALQANGGAQGAPNPTVQSANVVSP
jgi:hypothetical protein